MGENKFMKQKTKKKTSIQKRMKKRYWVTVISLLALLLLALAAYFAFEFYRTYKAGLRVESEEIYSDEGDFGGFEDADLDAESGLAADSGDGADFSYDILAGDDEIPVCSGSEHGKTHEIIKHDYYTLCYCEKFEQPEWVAYELTADELEKSASRKNNYHADPAVSTGSATPGDYKGTGYDRGHLAPAADMSFSEHAMDESFFMSNMSPQAPDLNRRLWLGMEEIEREWAAKYGAVYIVSGPVLNREDFPTIGANEVAVPDFFYKILLSWDDDANGGEGGYVWVAYLAPNEKTGQQPADCVTSVAEIERLTGIDFFPALNALVK